MENNEGIMVYSSCLSKKVSESTPQRMLKNNCFKIFIEKDF